MDKITFWDLITSPNMKKICIPTIQRDYALGRCNKVYNRQNFLLALKTATCTKEELTLDFVYGVDDETKFIPLDGQQRLTTLWLLHWYVAYKAGLLANSEIKEQLLKFSYETRISSTDFCKSLCSLAPNVKNLPLRTWITQQTWFFHQYRQDPTIMGMLNMISGTEITDKNGHNIIDGMEEIFKDEECDFNSIWERLTTAKCIIFNKLHVSLHDGDELYVKMNARGKQLTDFENFKTELVRHTKEDNILGETEALDFAAKLDVQWTDIFWNNRWVDGKTNDVSIDEIYFAFFRRYVRLDCIRKGKEDLAEKVTKTFTSFDIPYKEVLDKQSIHNFIKIMDNLRGHELNTQSPWGEHFDFIPKYTGEEKADITTLTNTQMLLFYGYCSYLLYGDYDSDSFSEWNRVLWNICENRVDKSKHTPTMSEIDMLAPYSHTILSYLSKEDDIECKYNKEQLLEEQRKARHIKEYPKIKEMEGYSFFHGAIRFLYTNSDNNEDWNSFELKSENIKLLIPKKANERHTIKLLTPYIPEQALCDIYYNYWVSNRDEDLRAILLYKNALPYLHNFLLQNKVWEYASLSRLQQDIIDLCENAFSQGYLQVNWDESKYIWTRYSSRRGYFGWSSFVIGNGSHLRVSNILCHSAEFEIHKDLLNARIGDHIPSLYIHFRYKEYWLTLFGNSTICLMTENWEHKKQNPDDSNGFYFPVENIETEYQLIKKIDDLITV